MIEVEACSLLFWLAVLMAFIVAVRSKKGH